MGKKLEKNLAKVQDMLDGNSTRKIQVSMHGEKTPDRKVGDKWFDAEGDQWEQCNGYRSKVSKLPGVGIAPECPDCESFIIKKWDKDSFKHNGRCYYCQIDFEAQYSRTFQTGVNRFAEFEGKKGAKKWAKLSRKKKEKFLDGALNDHEKYQLQRIEEYIKAFREEEKIYEKERDEEKVFDNSVANALANANIEMSINKNKTMSK
jgi:hypothetical protein